ncbi:ATP-dependent DNA ligase [Streptomyces cellulosae]
MRLHVPAAMSGRGPADLLVLLLQDGAADVGVGGRPLSDGHGPCKTVEPRGNLPAHAASLGYVVGFLAVRLPESTNLLASAFDLLRLSGTDTTSWPYRRRRAALESVFATRRLSAPWALCPSTTKADVVHEWLTWASVGMEGVVFKRLDDAYRPSARGWQKYKVRETSWLPGCSPHAAARQVRRRRPPSVRRPHHHPLPGGRCCGRRPARSGTAQSSVDRLVVLRQVRQSGTAERHVGGTRAGSGSRCRPRRLRPVAASRTLAPCAP